MATDKKKAASAAKNGTNDCIGVFDSGVGGLAILGALKRELPTENFVYVFDRSHSPYGNRSAKYVAARARKITELLCEKGAKAVVVACNTATSVGITALREWFRIPVVGVEPPVKPAVTAYPNGKIAVLVTPRTAREHRFIALTERYRADGLVVIPCPKLATAVEENFHDLDKVIPTLEKMFEACPEPDAVVLGCTHYYFLKSQIAKLLGGKAEIFDGADGVARRTKSVLDELGLRSDRKRGKTSYLYL